MIKILLSLLGVLLSSYSADNWREVAPGMEHRVLKGSYRNTTILSCLFVKGTC